MDSGDPRYLLKWCFVCTKPCFFTFPPDPTNGAKVPCVGSGGNVKKHGFVCMKHHLSRHRGSPESSFFSKYSMPCFRSYIFSVLRRFGTFQGPSWTTLGSLGVPLGDFLEAFWLCRGAYPMGGTLHLLQKSSRSPKSMKRVPKCIESDAKMMQKRTPSNKNRASTGMKTP